MNLNSKFIFAFLIICSIISCNFLYQKSLHCIYQSYTLFTLNVFKPLRRKIEQDKTLAANLKCNLICLFLNLDRITSNCAKIIVTCILCV